MKKSIAPILAKDLEPGTTVVHGIDWVNCIDIIVSVSPRNKSLVRLTCLRIYDPQRTTANRIAVLRTIDVRVNYQFSSDFSINAILPPVKTDESARTDEDRLHR